MIKKTHMYLLMISILFWWLWWLNTMHADSLSFPSWLTGAFPAIETQYSIVDFHVDNAFNGLFFWRDTKTLSTPVSVSLWSATIAGCTQQLQGLYYNNQRWFRLWPLDESTLTGLQAIDPSYDALSLTGGLFTNCSGSGVSSQAVYGALGHIRGGHTYWVLGWVEFDFANKTWVPTFSGSFLKNGAQATGWIFDSQGAIGEFGAWTGTVPPDVCDNGATNPSDCDQCPAGMTLINGQCRIVSSGWGVTLVPDYCPDGDFSPSYYDGDCGTPPVIHGAAPVGRACRYDDEAYLANGSFTDTIGHRWFPYIEIMRVSCLHRGRGTSQWLWTYVPNDNVTRAEVLKTVVRILGIEFDNFSVESEDIRYNGTIPFADVSANYWFAHYADYAFRQGLTDGLYTTDAEGNRYLDGDRPITRYEAIKVMMLAYNKIYPQGINTSGPSVMGDVINSNDPYYRYIREAEVLWFISGVPQGNGGFNFEGQRNILRSEFAKIISVPFTEQLFDVETVVMQSELYLMIVESLAQTTSNKVVFVNTLFNELNDISDDDFMRAFTLDKTIFLDVLRETIMKPIIEQIQITQ